MHTPSPCHASASPPQKTRYEVTLHRGADGAFGIRLWTDPTTGRHLVTEASTEVLNGVRDVWKMGGSLATPSNLVAHSLLPQTWWLLALREVGATSLACGVWRVACGVWRVACVCCTVCHHGPPWAGYHVPPCTGCRVPPCTTMCQVPPCAGCHVLDAMCPYAPFSGCWATCA